MQSSITLLRRSAVFVTLNSTLALTSLVAQADPASAAAKAREAAQAESTRTPVAASSAQRAPASTGGQADPEFNDWYLTGLGSYANPDSERDADYGAGGGALLGRYLNKRYAVEFGALAFDVKRETNADLDDFYYAAGPDLLVSLRPQTGFATSGLNPFALIGAGVFHDDVSRERDTTGYVNAGLGVLIPLGAERLKLRLEGRYVHVFDDDAPNASDATITETDFGEVIGSVGLQIALGAVGTVISDLDSDGVRDENDRCPNTPPGTPVDIYGCALDSDGDGVPDYKDRCPGTPAGTPVNEFGCARDFDKDGVHNGKDQCPNTPPGEDVDAFGCSRGNSCTGDCDKDGVINEIDQCPGTLPGLEVNAVGCVVKAQTFVLEGVNFEFDRSRLTPDSREILDAAAANMRGQPNIRVLIAGHTDSIGSDAYNLDLSDRRAASVRRYLVSKDVDPSRLTSRGFGESQPIASNETDAGRAVNRRVEFRILPPVTRPPVNR